MTASLDRQLVAALCRDARADIQAVAAETDAVATTVQKRLRALEENGTIEGHTARLNYGRLGYETAIFQLAVDLDVIDDVTARLRERPEFVTVYQMSGAFSVFAVAKFEDRATLSACLCELHDDPDIRFVDIEVARSVLREWGSPLVGD